MNEISTSSAIAAPGETQRLLDNLLAECVRLGASDLHLAPDLPPYFRTEGLLEPPSGRGPLSSPQIDAVAGLLSAEIDRRPLESQGSLDGALTGRDGTRYRQC
jgi:Tfp pilus assembly pilus retraction ATPase PilT